MIYNAIILYGSSFWETAASQNCGRPLGISLTSLLTTSQLNEYCIQCCMLCRMLCCMHEHTICRSEHTMLYTMTAYYVVRQTYYIV